MKSNPPLPHGQRAVDNFPRFGLLPFASRFPAVVDRVALRIGGDVETMAEVGGELALLPRVEQVSDFHCVTTWTRKGLHWSGVRFSVFYEEIVKPLANPAPAAQFVVLRGQDGARTSLPLEDLLASDVLLADRLDGEPLSVAHGAPLRLVAPAHYGYKSAKHVNRIEFLRGGAAFRPSGLRFMAHPRARVAYEERGQWVPDWILRHLYRPLIRPTAAYFEKAMREHASRANRQGVLD